MFEEKELLTVKETAEFLGVCEKTIYKLINTKKLFALKIGKKLLVPKSRIFDSLGKNNKMAERRFFFVQPKIHN